jgi:tetratricopeptide (TPR) repeat protein
VLLANPTYPDAVLLRVDRGEYDLVEAYLAAQRDSARTARAEADSAQAALHEANVTEAEAYLDWKRAGQPERAVERLQSIPQHRDAILYARVLLDAGRTEEAIPLLQSLAHIWNWTIAYYRLAALYEQLGEPDKARVAYSEFIERWKNADPRLQPMVDTARAALARLGPMDQ